MRLYPHKVNRFHSYLEEEVSHVVWRKEILLAQGTLLKKKKDTYTALQGDRGNPYKKDYREMKIRKAHWLSPCHLATLLSIRESGR